MRTEPKPYALDAGEGTAHWFFGSLVTVKAASEETDGRYALTEFVNPPAFASPLHVHHDEHEAFYVLEGEFTFNILGDEPAAAPKGTLVVVPRGTRHAFTGRAGSRVLVVAIPGGLAGFFEELGAGLATGHTDADLRATVAGNYDSYPAVP